MKVSVYRNLKFNGVGYSLRSGGRVVETRRFVILSGCTFKHATPEQIHRCRFGGANGTGCREVCQWVTGETVGAEEYNALPDIPKWRRLLCDPKKNDGFRDEKTGAIVNSARLVHLSATGGAFYVP
jgi:hypothetical protein